MQEHRTAVVSLTSVHENYRKLFRHHLDTEVHFFVAGYLTEGNDRKRIRVSENALLNCYKNP